MTIADIRPAMPPIVDRGGTWQAQIAEAPPPREGAHRAGDAIAAARRDCR